MILIIFRVRLMLLLMLITIF